MTDSILSASRLWGESFLPNDSDIEFIYNLLLEEGAPLTTAQLTLAIVRERLLREARRQARLSSEDTIYLPKKKYSVGASLVFPALNFMRGTVLRVRKGINPEFGDFDVITVENEFGERDFAAGIQNHRLNEIPLELMSGVRDITAEQIISEAGDHVGQLLTTRLAKQADIARVTDRWFPRALLADVSHGHLNLAEAVLDVANGGPLPTASLLEHVDIPRHIDPRLALFSLESALYEDERFDEVGPAGEMAWFLRKLEPPEIITVPRLLKIHQPEINTPLPDFLAALERELEDEWAPAAGGKPHSEVPISINLSYPHWRAGTLPLNTTLAAIFPHAHETTRIHFIFVDGDDGSRMPGWINSTSRYVTGLSDWYQQKGLLPGGIVKVQPGEKAGEIIISASTRRPIREWIRTVTVTPNARLSFSMQKQSIGVEFDELMVIAIADPSAVDEIWSRAENNPIPLARKVADVFRELAKLNPQSTVHARTVFCAMNVMVRITPGPVFKELAERPYFHNVGDLYYRFDEAQWTESQ